MDTFKIIGALPMSERIAVLKKEMLDESRDATIEQARIITKSYRQTEGQPRCIQRAKALKAALEEMTIRIEPHERIVGNRTPGVRGGVVFPETGASWVDREFETLPTRPQDRFQIHQEDVAEFRSEILPYWQGRSLEDRVREAVGPQVDAISKVVKINQKDHSQGHICPNTRKWLALGPDGIRRQALDHMAGAAGKQKDFYESVVVTMEGACRFISRYAELARSMYEQTGRENLREVAEICKKLAVSPAQTYQEAVQAVWFLYVILQMEGNASSFSPGRMDQYLYPYFTHSRAHGMTLEDALEITECLWLKFNQLVYLRNSNSAKYFAGFPIGFNVAIGGQKLDGSDTSNELSYLFLQAQAHLLLPQPNLSLRIYNGSPQELLEAATRVIAMGSGMPQIFNDEAVIPALEAHGIHHEDAVNYAIVGCVELTTHGNTLAWSDAAMFNLLKALELTLNHGVDQLTGEKTGLDLGDLTTYKTFEELEEAYAKQIDHFSDRTVPGGVVMNTNDGPMAAFTAAVEQAAAGADVSKGFFAHTLGTELGTGWVRPDGSIPEIPLEVYNFIIDLGSFRQKQYDANDVRSINNFNTLLPGTLQKYTCQSGVFRLAARDLPVQDAAAYEEAIARGLLLPQGDRLIVPTEPKDMRKPCLEYFMDKAADSAHPACAEIFRQIGEYLAVTWSETQYILLPETPDRTLFGRLVKNPACFDLMCQGAARREPRLRQYAADGGLANTALMCQLDSHPDYTVAQFAQAVGAIFYGCMGLL